MGCNCGNSSTKFKTAIFKKKAEEAPIADSTVSKEIGTAGQELLTTPDRFLTRSQRRSKYFQIRANKRNARIARRQQRNQQKD